MMVCSVLLFVLMNSTNQIFFISTNLLTGVFCVQHGESAVKTHHLEYVDGGILDVDDLLSDLVEDKDKVRMNRWTGSVACCASCSLFFFD